MERILLFEKNEGSCSRGFQLPTIKVFEKYEILHGEQMQIRLVHSSEKKAKSAAIFKFN